MHKNKYPVLSSNHLQHLLLSGPKNYYPDQNLSPTNGNMKKITKRLEILRILKIATIRVKKRNE